ncbi:protein qui-1-like [Mercenaria mercenaria]|uniref:protein qui-1-like n=1 Tax=Mercenaria mercenaria TaxID=6596 RepID=UPI00234E62D8|nr:protein qui-1-like [Mercenaria mercenaria]
MKRLQTCIDPAAIMIETDDFHNILTGQLGNIPSLPANVVKIFICANPTEFDVERKYLWHEVLPDLQQHCLQYGLDVLFIDMLHGNCDVTCSSENLQERISEIEDCHAESVGPFFLGLLGDQYGDVPLPAAFNEQEFLFILDGSGKSHGKRKELLQSWYRLDENAIPPTYVLKEEFHNDKANHDEWLTIYKNLLEAIQTSAVASDSHASLNQWVEKYFISGLERQIKQALWLSAEDTVFFFRTFQKEDQPNGFDRSSANSSSSSRKESRNHPAAHHSISKLKQDVLCKVPKSHALQLNISSQLEDFQESKKIHDDYIENFITTVTRKLVGLTDNKNANNSLRLLEKGRQKHAYDYNEKLVHLHRCIDLFNDSPFTGFEKYISKLQALLINGGRSDHQLSIIKGPEGSGKSTIIAKMCYRARELFGKDAVIIPVFVGLTAKALPAEDIFRDLCWQINLILKQEINIDTYSLRKLTNYFHGLMNRVSKSTRHLLIFIDGIDKMQLLQEQQTTTFDAIDWLATRLPPKFHITVSCSSTEHSAIVKRIENKLLNNDVIVYINNMSEDESGMVLNQILFKTKRKLTEHQRKAVINSFSKDRNPFVITEVSKMATRWHSWSEPNIIGSLPDVIPVSMESIIENKLISLEKSYGKVIVSALCMYITLARYGLTEVELMDVMSANDQVLIESHPQGQPMVLRFPYHIWARIRHEIGSLLCKRCIGNRTLFTWINKQCVAAVRQRYLSSPEHTVHVHRHLANIFMEQWNTRNPFVDYDDLTKVTEDVDRLLSPQPLVYNDVMYNLRKLHELWFHLLKSGDTERFKENTFCNFEYLLAMADADNIQKVMYNLDLVKSFFVDEDMHLLDLTLMTGGVALHTSPLQLANELIGRMRQIKVYFPRYIEPLVTQCMEWCDNYTLPLLVPLTTWLDKVHKPLVTSMSHDQPITCTSLMPNGQHIIIAAEYSISMFHIATRRKVKSFKGHTGEITCMYLDANNRMLTSGAKDKTVRTWNLDTESCLDIYRDFKSAVTCLLCLEEEDLICGTEDGSVVVKRLSNGDVVKTLSMHRKRVTAVRLCKSNTILITSSLDSKIIVWYTKDWNHMNIIDVDVLSPIHCIDISIDGTFLVAGCDNSSIHVIAMATGTVAQTIQVHSGMINSVSICSDSHHCVVATSSGDVYLYNFRANEVLNVFKGHKHGVTSTMLSENGQLVVTASKHEIIVWSLLKRYTVETYHDIHSGPVTCIAMTPDSKKLISGSQDGLLKTWNLDISDFSENFAGHTAAVTCLDLASDNSFAVSGSSDKTLKVWSITMATVITNYKGHDKVVSGVYVLSDNRLVLSFDVSQKIHMWRAEDGQTMRLYAGPTLLHLVAPNSQRCISGGGDNRLQIWNLSDGSVLKEISHTDKVTCLKCTKDSQYLVTGSQDRSVKVWELDTGKIVQIVVDHSSSVRCLAITCDNETILAAGDDGIIHVCSLTLGSIEKKLVGHFHKVTCLNLTADDSVLISGSLDNTIRVWNYRRGTQLTMFDTHYPVLGLVMTDTADRIGVMLANNNYVPIICLHNSPARPKPPKPVDNALSVISIQGSLVYGLNPSTIDSQQDLSDFSSEEGHHLPIKPKPSQRSRVPVTYTVPARRRRESSVSSIPQIIQHSPIRAPIQTTVKAQEKRRLKFPLPRKVDKPKTAENTDTKQSHICRIL